jgi:hypothetical protein
MDMVAQMSKFLATTAGNYELRVVLSSKDLPSGAVRRIMQWSRQYAFVTVRTSNRILWRDLQYHAADVLFWPSTIETTMLRGLHAYSYGISIIGVMANPMRELLAVNPDMSVPVSKLSCDRHGYPVKVSSATINTAMLSRLLSVVRSPAMLLDANSHVSRFISARRRMFADTMTEIFN